MCCCAVMEYENAPAWALGGRVKRESTREFDMYVLIYIHIWSVFGPSMSGNSDTKVSRHTKNHVAKIGLSGQKWATFRLVTDMSPRFPAKQA